MAKLLKITEYFSPCRILLYLIISVLLLFQPVPGSFPLLGLNNAHAQESREYVLKAGFIYNFSKFIKWPDDIARKIKADGLNLCVAGKDPFGNVLGQLSDKVRSRGEKIIIKRFKRFQEAKSCHILFISRSEKNELQKSLETLDRLPILLIGDTTGYAHRGVGINFYIEGNRTRFEINQESVERRGIRISSELLHLAKIVRGGN